MILTNLMNTISMSVGLIYVIPVVLYYITGNIVHLKAFLGVSGTTIISETIKYFFIGKASPRPQGATDCNMLCNDGNQEGRPGMPSSHSASVTFIYGFYAQQSLSSPIVNNLLLGYALMVMLSRYIKRCHSLSQIVAGASLGLSLSWFAVRQL
jgi:membrane-associated phospholipid phosphatase